MIQEAEYGVTDLAMQGQQGRFSADDTLLVKFFKHPKLNQTRSAEEGRPIYEDTDYIQIMQPGNKDSIIIRPAMEMDKQRFAEHFRRYEVRQDEEYVEGTLLDDWPGITRAQCEELKYLNIRTVEQLAAVSDSNAQGIMGIQALKAKAAKFLETAESDATAEKFADLEEKYNALLARLDGEEEEEVEED